MSSEGNKQGGRQVVYTGVNKSGNEYKAYSDGGYTYKNYKDGKICCVRLWIWIYTSISSCS